jgi:Tfp pilus assembly protein PilN
MPLVVTAILFLTLLAHYQYMKIRENSYKKQIEAYTIDLKNKKEKKAQYESILKESSVLKARIDDAEKRLAFSEKDADKKIEHLIQVLQSAADVVPHNIILNTMKQEGSHSFIVSGYSTDLVSVGQYATIIQDLEWCRSTTIKSIKQIQQGELTFECTILTRTN